MGMVNVSKQGPEAFNDNQSFDDLSFTSAQREFKPPTQKHVDWRLLTACVAGLTIAYIVLWLAYSTWKTFYCWSYIHFNACANLNTIEPIVWLIVICAPLVLVITAISARIYTSFKQSIALANRTNLVLTKQGDQMPADLFKRLNTAELMQYITTQYQIATNLEQAIAPHKLYRSVNSLSISNASPTPVLPNLIDIEPTLTAIPSDEWLQWIEKQPHIILAGATGKGKTVTAKPIIATRIQNQEQVFVIDPHSDFWFGLDVIGGGENWIEIKAAIQQITAEYTNRQLARETYRRINGRAMPAQLFKRLTIVMDEGYLISLHMNTAARGQISTWDQFAEIFSSGARKINISLMLLTQTANCEDLGISGPLRENFTRIAVDNRAIKLMIKQDESDAARRTQLHEALIGMAFPATTVVDTSVMLLDRTGLDRIPDPTVTPANQWTFVRTSHNGTNGHTNTTLDQLRALRAQGVTRDQARNDYGLTFDNDDW